MHNLISLDDFALFWSKNPIVIIDSCSLLDLYRYAPSASKRILNNLKEIQSDIWLPSHVVEEYFENKIKVVNDAHKKFENVTNDVKKIIKNADSDITSKFQRYGKFKYPNIYKFREDIDKIIASLHTTADSFKEVVSSEIKENKESLLEDEVNLFIHNLKENHQIGKPLPFSDLLNIYAEGAIRYNHLIPPGFKDVTKDKNDPTKLKKFGDLIIWKELLYNVKNSKRKVIFITDDEKEDWWELGVSTSHHGEKTNLIGPRKELVLEFKEYYPYDDNGFLMLTLPEFNKYISLIKEENFIETFLNDIEINPENIVETIVKSKSWSGILKDKFNIKQHLLKDDDLQDSIGELFLDCIIKQYSSPIFEDLNVDYDDDYTIFIEGKFNSNLIIEAVTEVTIKNHEQNDYALFLSGNISLEFKFNYLHEDRTFESNSETIDITNIKIDHYISLNSKEYSIEDTCELCFDQLGNYVTYKSQLVCKNCSEKFDICDGCGVLYDLNSLIGKHCSNCNYF